ncbi:MAG TPA: hypothetical protein VFR31_09515 [Thermoanaerobaculia bacterium]|nr:hypothetical protein [Thermoanaerobaculia bacterium]
MDPFGKVKISKSLSCSGILTCDPHAMVVVPAHGTPYVAHSSVYTLLANKQAPKMIDEDEMVDDIIANPEHNLRRTRGYNQEVEDHISTCCGVLCNEPGNIRKREMIGEIFAAMGVVSTGYQMIWGYGGEGHTGLDQVWWGRGGILVVEAKGGTGDLDTRPRYFEGTTHQAELGMNDSQSTSQMSPAWVFLNANGTAGQDFTKAVIQGNAINSLASPFAEFPLAKQYALQICRYLWRPKPELSDKFQGSVAALVDPHLPQPLVFDGNGRVISPDVKGITVLNGFAPWSREQRYSDYLDWS